MNRTKMVGCVLYLYSDVTGAMRNFSIPLSVLLPQKEVGVVPSSLLVLLYNHRYFRNVYSSNVHYIYIYIYKPQRWQNG